MINIWSFKKGNYNPSIPVIPDIDFTNALYLSNYGVSNDTILDMESTTYGVDDTILVQNVLDLAVSATTSTPLVIVNDCKVAISQLKIRSNTILYSQLNCGFKQIYFSNKQMVINYNRNLSDYANDIFTTTDYNIRISGGIYNQSGQVNGLQKQMHQTDNYQGGNQVFRFSGVNNIIVENVTIRNSRMYNIFINNCHDIKVHDIKFELPALPMVSPGNYDGCKILGPATNVRIWNISGTTHDDIISICSNDVNYPYESAKVGTEYVVSEYSGTQPKTYTMYCPSASYGDIEDVYIKNVNFVNSRYSIRLLSTTNIVKNCLIEDVHGVTSVQLFLATTIIRNWDAPFSLPVTYGKGLNYYQGGLFENLTLKNWDAEQNNMVDTWSDWGCLLWFDTKFKNLVVENCTRTDMTVLIPYIKSSERSTFDKVTFKNININPLTDTVTQAIDFNGTVSGKLVLDNVNVNRTFSTNSSAMFSGIPVTPLLKIINSSVTGCKNFLAAYMKNVTRFEADSITMNSSNNGVVFKNLNELGTDGTTETLVTNITNDSGSTMFTGHWGGV